MNQNPLISVCIPTYNRARMLGFSLRSVMGQVDPRTEVVVVDNASTDDTESVTRGFQHDNLRYVRNPRTVSMYENHNVCANVARGDWVVYLHSDDELTPDSLAILKRYIRDNPDPVLFYPAKLAHKREVANGPLVVAPPSGVYSIMKWIVGCPSGAAFRRDMLLRIPFDDGTIAADYLWQMQAALVAPICIVPEATVIVREWEGQYSTNWGNSGQVRWDLAYSVNRAFELGASETELLRIVDQWTDEETIAFLSILAYAGRRQLLDEIQKRRHLRTSLHDPDFRHVALYKALGSSGLRAAWVFRRIQNRARAAILAHRTIHGAAKKGNLAGPSA